VIETYGLDLAKPLGMDDIRGSVISGGKRGSTGEFHNERGSVNEINTAFLVEAAEIESRLRHHSLELLEPTIKKQGILESRLREAIAGIDKHSTEMNDLKKIKDDAEMLFGMVEGFRGELAAWDKERRTQEQEVGNRLSAQEGEITALRQQLERKGGDTASIFRAVKGLGDQLAQSRDETTELRRYSTERIDLNRDKLAKLRDEFETRMFVVENQMHGLQDSRTRTDTVIEHMKDLNLRMNARVDKASDDIADIWRSKASVNCLEEQQQDLTEFMRHVNATVSALKQQFGSLVDDVKAHFEKAAHVVGTSTAKQMDAMRSQYNVEVSRVDVMHEDMDKFLNKQRKAQRDLSVEVSQTNSTTSMKIEELKDELEELNKMRRLGENNFGIEIAQIRKDTEELKKSQQGQDQVSGFKNDVLQNILESQLLSAALDLQDDQDRKNIALFGYKANDNKDKPCWLPDLTGSECKPGTASNTSRGRTPRGKQKTGMQASSLGSTGGSTRSSLSTSTAASDNPVLLCDKRCLSCSGAASTVLAGFKLACLQYAPSPVEYEKATYNRSDLIKLRMDLLKQAKDQLNSRSID